LKEKKSSGEVITFQRESVPISWIYWSKSINNSFRKEVMMTTKRDLSRNGGTREASARVATRMLAGTLRLTNRWKRTTVEIM